MSNPATRWGYYSCDSPADLPLSAFATMKQFVDPADVAFSIFTGDIVSHDGQTHVSIDYVSYEEEKVYDMFKVEMPNVVSPPAALSLPTLLLPHLSRTLLRTCSLCTQHSETTIHSRKWSLRTPPTPPPGTTTSSRPSGSRTNGSTAPPPTASKPTLAPTPTPSPKASKSSP